MGTRHTPGPWAVSDARTIDGHPMVTGGDGAAWGLVAEVIEDNDARLIACAPELLEALTRLRNEAVIDGLSARPGWDAFIVAADEAIAKASQP